MDVQIGADFLYLWGASALPVIATVNVDMPETPLRVIRAYSRNRASEASLAKTLSKCARVPLDRCCACFHVSGLHSTPGRHWVATNQSAGLAPIARRKSQGCGDLLSNPSHKTIKSNAACVGVRFSAT